MTMNRMLHTCHVLPRPLSLATAAMAFIKGEKELGHQVHVVCPTSPDAAQYHDFHGATVTNLPHDTISAFSVSSSLQYVRQIAHALQGKHFDVVVVEAFRGCGLLPLLARKVSPNWLLHIRNSNLKSSRWRYYVSDLLTAWETRAYTTVVVCDEAVGHALLGRRPFYVVPNGADLTRYASGQRDATRNKFGILPADQVIIYIGTLKSHRRPVRILETFAQVAHLQPSAKLFIVGDGNHVPLLKAWAEEHQMSDRIIFAGLVPHETIQDYLAAADIGFAYYPGLPNYDVNIPLKTVEMLAAGLPTVTTDTYGNRTYITHGVNGLLAADDPSALATEIVRLFQEPELAATLRHNARASVAAYDWSILVRDRLVPLYSRLDADKPTSMSASAKRQIQ